eukprot:3418185-Rhodomonas_salina.1
MAKDLYVLCQYRTAHSTYVGLYDVCQYWTAHGESTGPLAYLDETRRLLHSVSLRALIHCTARDVTAGHRTHGHHTPQISPGHRIAI